jgi:two-component system response regulator PfeR
MMNNASILVIEDDQSLNQQLSELLSSDGYRVNQCYDGESGLTAAIKEIYDLILLDVMLPLRDGYSLLNILRKSKNTPVIMVSAKGAEEERILGFQQGADDYLAKPFNKTELLLRIEALLRRSQSQAKPLESENIISVDGLTLNHNQQSATVFGNSMELTTIQFSLLWALLENKGQVLSKPFLYQTVLNKTYGVHDRGLDMHLSRVRRKLFEANWNGDRLQTVHGKGYCLK